jgi:hypothetical protein
MKKKDIKKLLILLLENKDFVDNLGKIINEYKDSIKKETRKKTDKKNHKLTNEEKLDLIEDYLRKNEPDLEKFLNETFEGVTTSEIIDILNIDAGEYLYDKFEDNGGGGGDDGSRSGISGTDKEKYKGFVSPISKCPFKNGDKIVHIGDGKSFTSSKITLTKGKEYEVISVNKDDCSGLYEYVKIVNDDGKEDWYHYTRFDISKKQPEIKIVVEDKRSMDIVMKPTKAWPSPDSNPPVHDYTIEKKPKEEEIVKSKKQKNNE